MCFPMALGLIGAVVSAAGTIVSAQQQAAQANYNAKVAEINAQTEQQAAAAEADKIEDRYDQMRGQQRAAAAKSGLNIAAGSPSLVINEETTRNSWLDQQSRIWSGDTAATAQRNKAEQFRIEAKAAKTAGAFGAASTFLGGLGGAVRSGSTRIA